MEPNNILTKLLHIGIVVSSLFLYSCNKSECGPEPAAAYVIYINQTDMYISIKGYCADKGHSEKKLVTEEYSLKPQDSLIFRYSNSLRGNDSVQIIFNNRKELRYHSKAFGHEKYSIYDLNEYQHFKMDTNNYFVLKEIYTFSDKHLSIAETIKPD